MIFNSEIVGGSGGASIPMVAPLPTTIAVDKADYTVIGSPTISNKIVNGFTSSSYLVLPNKFHMGSDTWEVCYKLKLNSASGSYWCQGSPDATDFQIPLIGCDGGTWRLYISSTGSSWNIANGVKGSHSVSANTWYWIKTIFTGSQYIFKYSTNGTDWNTDITINSSLTAYQSSTTRHAIGMNHYNSSIYQAFNGYIDLSECYIKKNNIFWWNPYLTYIKVLDTTKSPAEVFEGQTKGYKNDLHMNSEEELVACKTNTIPEGELGDTIISSTPLYLDQNKENIELNPNTGLVTTVIEDAEDVANYTIVGSPTVANKIASGFSVTSYLLAYGASEHSSVNSMEMVFHFTTGSSTWSSVSERAMNPYDATTGDSTTAPFIEVASNIQLVFYNGSTYTSIKAVTGTTSNTEYWVKWESNGTTVSGYYSTDGATWNLTETKTFSPYFNTTGMAIGARRNSGTPITNFTGSVNLNDCYIKINGADWWKAYVDTTGTISVGSGSAYVDETTGYLVNDATATSTLAQAIVHPEDFPSRDLEEGKYGYVSIIKPTESTTKIILTGIRNPTAAYAGSVCTPVDRAVKVFTDTSLTKITGSESL